LKKQVKILIGNYEIWVDREMGENYDVRLLTANIVNYTAFHGVIF